MKVTKSLFLSFLMVGLFSFSSFAGDPVNKDKTSKVSEQIQKHLNSIDVTSIDVEETIKIDFMLNSMGEIMVISTTSKTIDSVLKNTLNYRKINTKNLERYTTYTVPVKFKK